jgi:hypothetical protein
MRGAIAERLVVELAWLEHIEDSGRDLGHLCEMQQARVAVEVVELVHALPREEKRGAGKVLVGVGADIACLEAGHAPWLGPGVSGGVLRADVARGHIDIMASRKNRRVGQNASRR